MARRLGIAQWRSRAPSGPVGRPAAVLALGLLLLGGPAAADGIEVAASIAPVHSLAASVMAGVASPALLVPRGAAPHGYQLKPSAARALARAQVVFWIGRRMESFLVKPIAALAGASVALADAEGVHLLATRKGGIWEAEEEEPAEGAAWDGHIWLDPRNARAMVAAMVETLARLDPADAHAYRANGEALMRRLDDLDRELAGRLAPVKDIPYLVFHDAYQYFEARYGLAALGSIAASPDQPPGARRVRAVRALLAKARCVFREPVFDAPLFRSIVAGTPAGTAELDPEGIRLEPGPDLYFDLMRGLARTMRDCLSAAR